MPVRVIFVLYFLELRGHVCSSLRSNDYLISPQSVYKDLPPELNTTPLQVTKYLSHGNGDSSTENGIYPYKPNQMATIIMTALFGVSATHNDDKEELLRTL